MRFSWHYYAIAVVLLFALMKISNKPSRSMLVSYLFLVIVATLIFRNPTKDFHYELIPFRILRVQNGGKMKDLLQQMLANIVMFIPIGILFTFSTKRNPILCGAFFSIVLESLQLITHRGVFEIDDILYNTCGAAIGVFLVKILIKFKNHI